MVDINWDDWRPLDDDSISLDTPRRGKYLFELIVTEQPAHADHFVRCIYAAGERLGVECACGLTYFLD